MLVAPASFNTVNKIAAGINDNLALGLVNEALGASVPTGLVPWVNSALTAHPAYVPNLDVVRSGGGASCSERGRLRCVRHRRS